MPSPKTLTDRLVRRLESVDRTRRKVERLLGARSISQRDVEVIYAGLFTNAVVAMEGFLEDLFTGLLCGRLTRRRARPRASFRQGAVATSFILNGRPYVEWLPYKFTKLRAEVFFSGGHPFIDLPGHLQDHLKKASTIRNVLVHSSEFAHKQFEDDVLAGINLPPRERRPVGFLRSTFRITPAQQRFEVYLNAFADAARFLAKNS